MKTFPRILFFLLCLISVVRGNAQSAYEYDRFRLGGYGEILANFCNYGPWRNPSNGGATREGRNVVSIPRFVLSADYRFGSSRKWALGVEVEFEAGGVGTAREIEWDDENGEYETELEKGGEVALEQFHITRSFFPELNVRAGHMVLPIGQINAHHEPTNYFGTSRPEAETAFLPSTWHETGLEIFGTAFDGLMSYQAFIVAGLNCDGFRRSDWIIAGKQGLFETDNFTSPAYVARLDFKPVKGLRFGGSIYHCANTGSNADKTSKYEGFKVPVTIWSADLQYKGYGVVARANYLQGNIGNTDLLSSARRNLPGASGYTARFTAAKSAISCGAEVGYNLAHSIRQLHGKACTALYPFFRYEYYNPCHRVEAGMTKYDQFEVSKWTVGLNYYPLSDLVVKADWTTRSIAGGKYRSENEFSIAVAYSGWFLSDSMLKARRERRESMNEQKMRDIISDLNERLSKLENK